MGTFYSNLLSILSLLSADFFVTVESVVLNLCETVASFMKVSVTAHGMCTSTSISVEVP